jgi:diacylglycerol kinase family enzyme/CDGSH-type Zn-finger protein
MSKRIAVVFNPSARGGKALTNKKKVLTYLDAKNIRFDLFVTGSEPHLFEIADWVVDSYPVIVGVGGDTTMSIIANEILRKKKGNILGIISQGSTNDLARGIGVHKLEDACNAIAAGTYRAIDVGVINSGKNNEPYFFIAQASMGLGVAVSRYVDAWMKRHTFMRRFHTMAQTTMGLAGIYNSFKTKAVPMNMRMEFSKGSRSVDPSLLIFHNSSYYAGRFKPSPSASPMDGKLDCCIFNSHTFPNLLKTIMQIKSMKHLEDNKVEVLQDHYFKILSSQSFEFQIDGEIFRSDGEIEVSIMPGALKMIVNPDYCTAENTLSSSPTRKTGRIEVQRTTKKRKNEKSRKVKTKETEMSEKDRQKMKPCITLTKHTPYMVSDLENFTNSKGEKLDTFPVMSLCRCGESKNKPYCDGSHAANGIDGEKKPGRVKDKLRSFKGKEIIIHDNRGVCSHDRACVNELPRVFEKGRKPWINPDGAPAEEVASVIEKCPSGALSYTTGDVSWTGFDCEPAINVAKDGPLEINGGIVLKDDMGSKPQLAQHYTLCRCGGSKNKPFCDGTHHDKGFSDDKN